MSRFDHGLSLLAPPDARADRGTVGRGDGHRVDADRRRFYRDDPIAREPESQDASGAKPYEIESLYEMTHNLFVTAGYKPSGTRAQNINTIDEVPDSSWFTNRIGARPIERRRDRARADRRRAARSVTRG